MIDWLLVSSEDVAIPLLPKCASTSLREAMECWTVDVVDIETARKASRRPVWIREPLDRLISAYSFFKAMSEKGTRQEVVPVENLTNWSAFLDWALESNDPHVAPIVPMLTYKGEFVPTAVHKVSDIVQTFGQYLPALLPWLRAVTHQNIDKSYRAQGIERRYSEDFALWRSL